jgi:acetylornithine deacetylase/succinyl-diaminopimelate desuccinylase-like protein
VFSTNGTATTGMHGVPTIGFGPADEQHAHAPTDQCPAQHIPAAVTFYTQLVNRARAVFPLRG